jgi:hypothetical protein
VEWPWPFSQTQGCGGDKNGAFCQRSIDLKRPFTKEANLTDGSRDKTYDKIKMPKLPDRDGFCQHVF